MILLSTSAADNLRWCGKCEDYRPLIKLFSELEGHKLNIDGEA